MDILKPCPFCGRIPTTYWDHVDKIYECFNEGFNIDCCVVHISNIYKKDAIDKWNTRI